MHHEVLDFATLCSREGLRLQQGMHYRIGVGHSVILMCNKRNAPYGDKHVEKGAAIIYQGHDAPKAINLRDPKSADQPEFDASGRLTQNGAFLKAVELTLRGLRPPEPVRVYQKLAQGIWCYHGMYSLLDGWREHDGNRHVFWFRLEPRDMETRTNATPPRPRTVPAAVRRAVWLRDQGRCVVCGATEDLHFDHIIPYSKGGSSWRVDNVQLLCSRHNLRKSDKV